MGKWQILFADSTGASVIIEGDEIIQKEKHYQAMTNFNQSLSDSPYSCTRYNTAVEMLDTSNDISINLCRDICDATHQVHDWYTQYSNVCDLKNGIIYLYLKYNFDDVTIIDLKEELQKGEKTYRYLPCGLHWMLTRYRVPHSKSSRIIQIPFTLLPIFPITIL